MVLGGDADEACWQSIWEKYGANIRCNVLKASHHGRNSGFHLEAVKAMNPEYTIVSVGKKPSTDACNRYRSYTREKSGRHGGAGILFLTIHDNGGATIAPEFEPSPNPRRLTPLDPLSFLLRH